MLEDSALKAVPRWLFDEHLRVRWRMIIAAVFVVIAWAAMIFVAAYHDDVLSMRNGGRGLLDHYGFIALFLIGPLILLNTSYAVAYFLRLIRDMGPLLTSDLAKPTAEAICGPHVESILLGGKWKYMLFMLCIIGVEISIVNFSHLGNPAIYWGNDVFNAWTYKWSFLSANLYLLVLWGVVCPLAFFYIFHIAVSAQIIAMQLERRKILRLNFLHVDRCAGMAKFGTLNVILMVIYVWLAIALWALLITHKFNYSMWIAAAVLLPLCVLAHSTLGIWWIAKTVRAEREDTVTSLNERIQRLMDGKHSSFTAAVATMAYRDRVLAVSSFPYSRGDVISVNLFAAVAAVLQVVLQSNTLR